MNWQKIQVVILTGTFLATCVTAVFTLWRAVVSEREYNMKLTIAQRQYPGLFDRDIHGQIITGA